MTVRDELHPIVEALEPMRSHRKEEAALDRRAAELSAR